MQNHWIASSLAMVPLLLIRALRTSSFSSVDFFLSVDGLELFEWGGWYNLSGPKNHNLLTLRVSALSSGLPWTVVVQGTLPGVLWRSDFGNFALKQTTGRRFDPSPTENDERVGKSWTA